MASENIIIEISADAQKLTPVIDQLVKLGQVSAKDAEEFKKIAAASQVLTTETLKTTEAVKASATATTQASAAKQAALEKEKATLIELTNLSKKAADPASAQRFAAAIKESENRIKGLNTELNKTPKPVKEADTAFKSLRTQLLEARNEAVRLAEKFGEFSPQAIAAANAAAKIDDKVKDLNRTIAALNPEQRLGAFLQIGTGISGAFTAAQGAMALFGAESEDAQKALLKVQAALALTQGLQSVLGLKDAFRDLRILLGITAVAQNGLTAATVAGATATNVATVATRGFITTLFASPLAPIILALGALTAAFLILKKSTDDAAEAQEAFNKLSEESAKRIKEEEEFITEVGKKTAEAYKRDIALLQAQGAKEKEIFDARERAANVQLRALNKLKGFTGSLTPDQVDEEKNLRNELNVIDAERTNFLIEQDKKRSDALKKLLAEEKAIRDQIFQNQLRANELGARNELDLLQIKLVNLKLLEDKEFKEAEKNELKKFEIVLRFANLRKEVERDISKFIEENNKKIISDFEQTLKELNKAKVDSINIKTPEIDFGDADKKIKKAFQSIFGEGSDIFPDGIDALKDFASEAEEIFFDIFDNIAAGFEANADAIELEKDKQLEAYDEQLEGLEELNNNKIISDGKYAQEKKRIEKEREQAEKVLNKRIADEKRKAFLANRIATLSEIAISTAMNAVKLFAQTIPPGILSALAVAFGALQAGIVLSQPIPKFKKGILDLQGLGTGESDSIPAMLSKGESVMTAKETKMFMPTLSAIRKNLIPAEVMNKFVVEGSGGKVEAYIDTNLLNRANNKMLPKQADLIGKSVAKYLKNKSVYSPIRGEWVN